MTGVLIAGAIIVAGLAAYLLSRGIDIYMNEGVIGIVIFLWSSSGILCLVTIGLMVKAWGLAKKQDEYIKEEQEHKKFERETVTLIGDNARKMPERVSLSQRILSCFFKKRKQP